MKAFLWLAAFAAAAMACAGEVRAVSLAGVFGDHMVLQRDRPVAVWGSAEAGEPVRVSFAGAAAQGRADSAGRWKVALPPLSARSAGSDLVVAGTKDAVSLHDVVVGEVWLCAGQSNLGFSLSHADRASEEIAAADDRLLRHVWIDRTLREVPQGDVRTSGWKSASPRTAGAFSAVAYYFARDLRRAIGVPVGVIVSSWPGTPIESWLSRPMLESDPAFAVIFRRWDEALEAYPRKKPAYDAALARWQASEPAAAKADPVAHAAFIKGHPAPPLLLGPGHPYTPSGIYNGMIAPLLPATVRGVIWYQGETNAGRPQEYAPLFRAWVTGLRANLGVTSLPFFWVQLPNFKAGKGEGSNWAQLRAAQHAALDLPGTAEAVTIDVGDPESLHPTHKQPVGHRLALLAEAHVYRVPVEWSGPEVVSVIPEDGSLRLRFSHAKGGVVLLGTGTESFEVAASEGSFVPATAVASGDSIRLSSAQVPRPVRARYAWKNAPRAILFNPAGLPASPFEVAEPGDPPGGSRTG